MIIKTPLTDAELKQMDLDIALSIARIEAAYARVRELSLTDRGNV